MAEATALALAATINDELIFNNTTFLPDWQELVQFLNDVDQSNLRLEGQILYLAVCKSIEKSTIKHLQDQQRP